MYNSGHSSGLRPSSSRRAFLRTAGMVTAAVSAASALQAHAQGAPLPTPSPSTPSTPSTGQVGKPAPPPAPAGGGSAPQPAAPERETYATHAKGIRILPGQWRPHYHWEHIVWISPSWPSQDYLWLDFPEAIFTSQGLLYLSHVNPPFPTVFTDLPQVPWRKTAEGLAFERELPNGIHFGGSVSKRNDTTVDLELRLKNGTPELLGNITLQTCAFLRGIKEFADYTRDNKYVHVPDASWIPIAQASERENQSEKYRVGWRTSGKPVADLPICVTLSNQAERFAAMTWLTDTLSMVSNPNHPCMHADPKFKDLQPGEAASIYGRIGFFEGTLQDFDHDAFLRP